MSKGKDISTMFTREENEKKLLTERESKIKYLKETIENAQKELKELENL